MVALGQTITIVNKSGKVVKTSKHLVNVWNEAKAAYSEKKAEIKALRNNDVDSRDRERKVRRQLDALTLDDEDTVSRTSSRRSSRSRRDHDTHIRRKPVAERRSQRPPIERNYTDTIYASDLPSPSRPTTRPSPLRQTSSSPRAGELTRRHTTDLQHLPHRHHQRPSTPTRSASLDDIDMDLAYGSLPPPLPERKYDTEIELRAKISGLQRLLDECNCLQHSVTATIDTLQKNPDALAAVALSLAEISNLAAKLAPGALGALKGSFPAVVAMLASPQFAIAVGVGVGVTVIALGGYKIIKKIRANKEEEGRLLEAGGGVYPQQQARIRDEPENPGSEMDELREISGIEVWRRGIADAEVEGLSQEGTSVEGEFVTPVATRTLIEEGRLREADLEPSAKSEKKRRRKKRGSEAGSSKASSSSTKKAERKPKKEPSGLRMLFKSHA